MHAGAGAGISHLTHHICMQALVLAVALNSHRNGLLALLIANNFVEIKGAVFKRWDVPRIWGLVCMVGAWGGWRLGQEYGRQRAFTC